jgi:hypothetical protein
MNFNITTRAGCNRSSAELYSAVSRIFNPLAAGKLGGFAIFHALPNAIGRYSRLQICTPAETVSEFPNNPN